MIILTGAAGFIGSCMIAKLNEERFFDIVAVDDFSNSLKNKNIENKTISLKVNRNRFFNWLDNHHKQVQFIFHIGARTDTTEFDINIFDQLNLNYSKNIWQKCSNYGIPLIYASSAATYGDGNLGYNDDHSIINSLKPLNPYGESKNEFDKWALMQSNHPYFWTGLKFFNVYGPNEYHKARMASVIFHAFNQVKETKTMNLFRSHKPEFEDGEQKRDFVYVKDVCKVMFYLMNNRNPNNNGIYNLGTGKAASFNTLAKSLFKTLNLPEKISYVDTPEDIREKYQYFTEAKMDKLRSIGFEEMFISLEEGIQDYVLNYLTEGNYY